MSVSMATDKGTTKVEIGGVIKELEFQYQYVKDENGAIILFDDLIAWMKDNGYNQELPTKDEREKLKEENKGIRGKVAEPRSITRCLLSAIKDYNYQDARNTCLDSALNTEEAQFDRAINQTVELAIKASSDKVARFAVNNIVGLAEENKTLAVSTLERISKHSGASEFLKGIALDALSALTE